LLNPSSHPNRQLKSDKSEEAVSSQLPERSVCFENDCAEGTLECGSASCRLSFGFEGRNSAAALQGASRIFMVSGCLLADGHEGLLWN